MIGHGAAGGDDAVKSGRVDDVAGRQVAEIVAGGRSDEDARVVQCIHGIGPCCRSQPPHAHRHDMDLRARILAELMHVIQSAGDGAVAEQHNPVGNAQRHHLDERRRTNDTHLWHRLARENTERAGALTQVVQQTVGVVARIVGILVINEIPLKVEAYVLGQCGVSWVIAGVEMGDAHRVGSRFTV